MWIHLCRLRESSLHIQPYPLHVLRQARRIYMCILFIVMHLRLLCSKLGPNAQCRRSSCISPSCQISYHGTCECPSALLLVYWSVVAFCSSVAWSVLLALNLGCGVVQSGILYPVVVRFDKTNYSGVSTNNFSLTEVEVVK